VEPTDALYNIVEASLALAGFAGIVTALGHRPSGQWRLDDRDRIVNLLLATLLPFVLALLALVLIHAEVTSAWRMSSACFALLLLGNFVVGIRDVLRARKEPEISIRRARCQALVGPGEASVRQRVRVAYGRGHVADSGS
jgi:hypothetical protein